ncbi:MAG: phage head completion protein, partial [Methyloceanibacter sp.]
PVFVGDQLKGITTYKIIIRFFEGLTSKQHRIMFEGRIFDILSLVVPGERKALHELLAQEQI